jgi:hypothetical protein
MYITAERRIKPRVTCDYPAIVDGHDEYGIKFTDTAKITNLSATGLFMKANRRIEIGSQLSVTIILTCEQVDNDTPKILTNGIVVRSEPQLDGTCGIALKFNSYRFK